MFNLLSFFRGFFLQYSFFFVFIFFEQASIKFSLVYSYRSIVESIGYLKEVIVHCTFCRLAIKWIRNQRQELLNYNSLENTFWSSCWLCQEKLNKLLSPALYYLHRSGCSYNIPIEKKSWAPLLGYLFLTTFSERSRWWIECNGRSNDAQWRFLCSLSLIISIDSQF